MTMTKYRIKELDPVNDIWLLQKRFLGIFWKSVSWGTKKKLEEFLFARKNGAKMTSIDQCIVLLTEIEEHLVYLKRVGIVVCLCLGCVVGYILRLVYK